MKSKKVLGLMFCWGLVSFYPLQDIYTQIINDQISFSKDCEEIRTVSKTFETLKSDADMHILREDTIMYFDEEIPYEVQECAQIYGAMYDICPEFLEAIAFYESRYIPTVENGSCVGLMQVNVDCPEHLEAMASFGLTLQDMYEVDASMMVAAHYLHSLFEIYEDPAEVLMRYNGDATGLKKFHKTGEVSKYAQKILNLSEELEIKHQHRSEMDGCCF